MSCRQIFACVWEGYSTSNTLWPVIVWCVVSSHTLALNQQLSQTHKRSTKYWPMRFSFSSLKLSIYQHVVCRRSTAGSTLASKVRQQASTTSYTLNIFVTKLNRTRSPFAFEFLSFLFIKTWNQIVKIRSTRIATEIETACCANSLCFSYFVVAQIEMYFIDRHRIRIQ